MFFFFLYAKSLSVGFLFPFYGYGGPHNSPEFIVGLGREGRTGGEDYCLLRWCCVWLFPFFLFCFPHLSLRFAAFFFFFFALLFPSFLPSSPPLPFTGAGGAGVESGVWGGVYKGGRKSWWSLKPHFCWGHSHSGFSFGTSCGQTDILGENLWILV